MFLFLLVGNYFAITLTFNTEFIDKNFVEKRLEEEIIHVPYSVELVNVKEIDNGCFEKCKIVKR